ncbi:MAG: glycosyltransferase family 2 protein [Erysipelotrichaceae bacterium]|nr:glycosyltransferase family 2 protein [Erysipelotrichaceae bacterium]
MNLQQNGSEDKISIIIPVYNVEPYIDRCLNSVVNQTYDNIEIIVVIDGSEDGSEKICIEYAERDDRIILIKQENRGLSAARNTGLSYVTGEYIMFVDSDDYVEKDFCLLPLQRLKETDSDIVMFDNDMISSGKSEYPILNETEFVTTDNIKLLRMNILGNINEAVWNKIFKAELFNDIRFPEGEVFEDIATLYKILEKCERFSYLQKTLYHYIKRDGSITDDHSIERQDVEFVQRSKKFEYLRLKYPELEKELSDYFFFVLFFRCHRICLRPNGTEKVLEFRQKINELYGKYKPELKLKHKIGLFLLNHSLPLYRIVNKIRISLGIIK